MAGKKLTAAALAAMLILFSACGIPGTASSASQPPEALTDQELRAAATDLLDRALDELFLYQGEIPVDKSAEPYRSPEGRRYYPVVGFATLAELRTHSREIFTDGFCQNVLDDWAADPDRLRFLERDGGLWESRQGGGMGWINALVLGTLELARQGEDRCVASVYSQSMLGEISREEFVLLREDAGWRLDSYYRFNQASPVEYGPTVGEYLAQQDDGRGTLLALSVTSWGGTALALEERMLPPFQAVLAALEYDPDSVETAEAADNGEDADVLNATLYTGSYSLVPLSTGELYITEPNGQTTRMRLTYPSGLSVLKQLIDAAKWRMKAF